MRKYLILTILFFTARGIFSQGHTAGSMFLKGDPDTPLEYIESNRGNLFSKLGHHGPAIENQWYALRLYFNRKGAIDVYSKAKPGLELADKKWYPSKKDQLAGWGADYYKVGNTLGLGGIELWDGEKVLDLHPVKLRSARVTVGEHSASMEMISEGIAYRGRTVDIKVRVTVFASRREARVEAFSMTGEAVRFVTGINYFKSLRTKKDEEYALTWGIHPEDVAAEKYEVGAALILPKGVIEGNLDDGKQFLFITKPVQSFSAWITSYSSREAGIDSFESFNQQIEKLIQNENSNLKIRDLGNYAALSPDFELRPE